MKIFRLIPAALIGASLLSCEENGTIGSSVIQDNVDVFIDSSFTVSGHSILNPVIQSRTDNQLLGRIDAKGFGRLTSDFISQLMPANALDTVGVTINDLDSIKLFMFMKEGDLIGDSIIPMGLDIYKVDKALPSPIYSDFDPDTYFSPNSKIASKIYSATVLGMPDSDISMLTNPDTAMRVVDVKLPIEMARDFYTKYKSDPTLFSDPIRFSEWFPGLYIKNSFGTGRMMRFRDTYVSLYYRKTVPLTVLTDTVYNLGSVILAVTPEVITNNNMNLSLSDNLVQLAGSKPVLAAPIGYDVEVNLPIKEIIEKYHTSANSYSVVNSMTLEIPAEEISNIYGITPPTDLLLVKKSEKDNFFADQQLYNNTTSFYATYNSAKKSYTFSSMRQYFLDMWNKESVDATDGDFILTPVSPVTEKSQSYYYSTSTVIMAVVPYVGTPTMATLNLSGAKIKLTFSRQTIE